MLHCRVVESEPDSVCSWALRVVRSIRKPRPSRAFGTEPGTHIWLHRECWSEWRKMRPFQAKEALTRMGIGRLSDACSEPMECDQCGKSTGTVQQAWICDPGGQPITARLHRECEAAFLQQLEPSWDFMAGPAAGSAQSRMTHF